LQDHWPTSQLDDCSTRRHFYSLTYGTVQICNELLRNLTHYCPEFQIEDVTK